MIRNILLASAVTLALTGAAFAQTTGPSGQQDTNKAGMANPSTPKGSSMSPSRTSGTAGPTTTTPGSTTGPSGQTMKPDAR